MTNDFKIILLSLLFLVFAQIIPSEIRMNPGGPFIFISSDIIPVISIAFILAITFKSKTLMIVERIISGIAVDLILIFWIPEFVNAYSFWIGRSSRGILIGW